MPKSKLLPAKNTLTSKGVEVGETDLLACKACSQSELFDLQDSEGHTKAVSCFSSFFSLTNSLRLQELFILETSHQTLGTVLDVMRVVLYVVFVSNLQESLCLLFPLFCLHFTVVCVNHKVCKKKMQPHKSKWPICVVY